MNWKNKNVLEIINMEKYTNLTLFLLVISNIFHILIHRINDLALKTRNTSYKVLWDDYMEILGKALQVRLDNEVLSNKLINLERKLTSKNKRL